MTDEKEFYMQRAISRLCIGKYAAPAYICIDIQIASCNRKKKSYEIRL